VGALPNCATACPLLTDRRSSCLFGRDKPARLRRTACRSRLRLPTNCLLGWQALCDVHCGKPSTGDDSPVSASAEFSRVSCSTTASVPRLRQCEKTAVEWGAMTALSWAVGSLCWTCAGSVTVEVPQACGNRCAKNDWHGGCFRTIRLAVFP
jgi:hypothetical protein